MIVNETDPRFQTPRLRRSILQSLLWTGVSLAASVLLQLLATQNAFAAVKEVRFKDMPIDVRANDRLLITGYSGTVRLFASEKGNFIRARKVLPEHASGEAKARFEALTFNIKRVGQALVIEQKGLESKGAGGAWLRSTSTAATTPMAQPELILEIASRSVPAEISLHDGQVSVVNWREKISASVVAGSLKTSATQGELNLQVQTGEARVESHKGPAEIDSYGAKLIVEDMDGALDLTNFAGESVLNRVHGRVEMRSRTGSTSVAKSSGSIEFLNGRGAVNLSDFDGPVRGRTDEGAVNVAVEGEAEVDVDSDQGNVAVRLPANSGAALRLQTHEGGIVAPEDIRMSNSSSTSGKKTAVGRLQGDGPRGIVAVRSNSGAIRVR